MQVRHWAGWVPLKGGWWSTRNHSPGRLQSSCHSMSLAAVYTKVCQQCCCPRMDLLTSWDSLNAVFLFSLSFMLLLFMHGWSLLQATTLPLPYSRNQPAKVGVKIWDVTDYNCPFHYLDWKKRKKKSIDLSKYFPETSSFINKSNWKFGEYSLLFLCKTKATSIPQYDRE